MKQISIISIAVFFIVSCNNNQKEEQLIGLDTINNKTKPDSLKVINSVESITDRLFKFAGFLDSIGYSCDTNRLKITYNFKKSKRIKIDKYYFYTYPVKDFLEETNNLIYFDTIHPDNNLIKSRNDLAKVQSVYCYFYTKRTPEIIANKKWYIDGLIFELNFVDINAAKNATNCLKNTKEFNMYGINFCYVENHIYIFNSRSSGFSNQLKDIFNSFVRNNKAIAL